MGPDVFKEECNNKTYTELIRIRDGLLEEIRSFEEQVYNTEPWYDNEGSYTSQMVRTIKYFAEL